MEFTKLCSNDYDIIIQYMNSTYGRLCDYTPSATLMWAHLYDVEYYTDGEIFVQRAVSPYNGEHFYCLPLGNIDRGIRAVLDFEKGPVLFGIIPKEYVPLFDLPGYSCETVSDRDHFDYLYLASELIELKGKKYAGQRNHIHRFDKAVSGWELRDIGSDNIDEVVHFYQNDFKLISPTDSSAISESAITLDALTNTKKYGLNGSALYADGRIVGFALSEIIGDTLFVHSEKADRSFPGAYQKLVNTYTARHAADGVVFVNREDDLGNEGLRTAKLAYHPCSLLEKTDIKMIKKEP